MYLDLHVGCICLILNKSGFSQQIFMKDHNINLMEIHPVGAVLIHVDSHTIIQTGAHDKAKRYFLQLCQHIFKFHCFTMHFISQMSHSHQLMHLF